MAGSAKSVITPPVSFPIFSPEFENRKSEGILDDLLCRVVVINIFDKKIMFVSLDIWGISDYLLKKIRNLVSKKIKKMSLPKEVCIYMARPEQVKQYLLKKF